MSITKTKGKLNRDNSNSHNISKIITTTIILSKMLTITITNTNIKVDTITTTRAIIKDKDKRKENNTMTKAITINKRASHTHKLTLHRIKHRTNIISNKGMINITRKWNRIIVKLSYNRWQMTSIC